MSDSETNRNIEEALLAGDDGKTETVLAMSLNGLKQETGEFLYIRYLKELGR